MSWSFTLLSSKFVFLICDAGHGIAATFVDVLKEVKYNTIQTSSKGHVHIDMVFPNAVTKEMEEQR